MNEKKFKYLMYGYLAFLIIGCSIMAIILNIIKPGVSRDVLQIASLATLGISWILTHYFDKIDKKVVIGILIVLSICCVMAIFIICIA